MLTTTQTRSLVTEKRDDIISANQIIPSDFMNIKISLSSWHEHTAGSYS
jgi:hypothetical protein